MDEKLIYICINILTRTNLDWRKNHRWTFYDSKAWR